MITRDYLNSNDISLLAEWMQSHLIPNFFDDIEYDNVGFTITCKYDGNTLLTISKPNTTGIHTITAYKSVTVSDSITTGTSTVSYACNCENGALITFGTASGLLITKTNQDKVAVVFSTNNSQNRWKYENIKRVAWGDTTLNTGLTFTPINSNQVHMVQFTTYCPYGETSFTPYAFWLLESDSRYDIPMKCIINGKQYLSNGYWAILDVDVQNE